MRHPITFSHLSDTHLGLTQYPVTSGSGRNQRDQDFSRAFLANVTRIDESDHAMTIHSGDWFDNSRPSWRHVMQGLAALEKLTSGGRIVLIAAGNHDMPAQAGEACALDLYSHLPGVHVATNKYKVIDLAAEVAAGRARPELDNVAVHLLPHDALKGCEWDEITPWEGYTNILVSHCVVGGTALYKRSIGREYSLPIDVVTRGWDYVALGHWHKQGPVAVGGYTDATTPAWYAGSTENNGFSDVRDSKNGGSRGHLEVSLTPGEAVPQVSPVDLPIRAMFRLPVIDATGLDHAAITEAMATNARQSDIAGAVVRQVVTNIHPDTWGLVDVNAARQAARDALWYETKPEFATPQVHAADGSDVTPGLGDLAELLHTTLGDMFGTDPHREDITELATRLLGSSLNPLEPAGESCCSEQPEGVGEPAQPGAGHRTPEPAGV